MCNSFQTNTVLALANAYIYIKYININIYLQCNLTNSYIDCWELLKHVMIMNKTDLIHFRDVTVCHWKHLSILSTHIFAMPRLPSMNVSKSEELSGRLNCEGKPTRFHPCWTRATSKNKSWWAYLLYKLYIKFSGNHLSTWLMSVQTGNQHSFSCGFFRA